MKREQQIIDILERVYPNAGCELNYSTPFELLVAVILSAQCTDKRVNEVTKTLFVHARTPQQFAEMPFDRLEQLIFSCGFYRNKAKNIILAAQDIVTKHGGVVPNTLEQLTALSGVGRKTANVMLSVAFNQDAIAVDTHVFRVSRRLGFSTASTPNGVEKDLDALFDGYKKGKIHHLLIFHGRYCCKSLKPLCDNCPLNWLCESSKALIK